MVITDKIQQEKGFKVVENQLNKYIEKPTSARKGKITIAINALERKCKYPPKLVIEAILELLTKLEKPGKTMFLLAHWRDRLQGAPVIPKTSQSVYGKWHDDQVLAEPLPLTLITEDSFFHGKRGFKVSYEIRSIRSSGFSKGDWESRGFAEAVTLPLHWQENGQTWRVTVPFYLQQELLSHGYAAAIPIQWSRRTETFRDRAHPNEENCPGLYVERSIIAFGFWKAYRWWQGCKLWYYERHPEWFWDDPVWGESEVVEAVIVPEGAAVISPQSLALLQQLNIKG